MELALAIFNIGVGLGVLAAGASLAFLVWQTAPLIRDARALTRDLRRLARLTDTELRPLLDHAREVGGNVEILSEDAAVKLDRLGTVLSELQGTLERSRLAPAVGRPSAWSVESPQHQREDEGDG